MGNQSSVQSSADMIVPRSFMVPRRSKMGNGVSQSANSRTKPPRNVIIIFKLYHFCIIILMNGSYFFCTCMAHNVCLDHLLSQHSLKKEFSVRLFGYLF